MCFVCQEWLKGKMTVKEARNGLSEVISVETDPDTLEHMTDIELELTRLMWEMKGDKRVTEL